MMIRPKMPCSKAIASLATAGKSADTVAVRAVRSFGRRIMNTAPNREPRMLPSPPMMIIARYTIETSILNCSEETYLSECPNRAPATPA